MLLYCEYRLGWGSVLRENTAFFSLIRENYRGAFECLNVRQKKVIH
jgi:hypothetical protein